MDFLPMSEGELQGRGLNSGPRCLERRAVRVLPRVIKLNGKMCSEGVAACHKIERKDVQ